MAYQKLQTQRAIAVIPNDSGTVIPSPGDEIVSGTSDAAVPSAANILDDASGGFLSKVQPGAVVYNTTDSTTATVTGVISDTKLTVSANIFAAGSKAFKIYSTRGSEGPVLYVGTGGTVVMKTVGGDTVTLVNVPDASFLPIMTSVVVATGTTASNILGLW